MFLLGIIGCKHDRSVESGELLLLEWDSRRKRSHVPVDMRICLSAPEAQNVQPLGW